MELSSLANEAGLTIGDYHLKKLKELVEVFLERSRQLNLTSIKSDQDILVKHIIDSLIITKYIEIKSKMNVLDLGTGGGFPGLPLAILHPQTNFVLIDSNKRKVESVNEFAKKLTLTNIVAIQSRAEDMGHDINHREKYDVVISRAVAPLRILLEYALPFTKPHGVMVAYKGPAYINELIQARGAMNLLKVDSPRIIHYELPQKMGNHAYLIFKKTESTPDTYPRRTGIPTKRPL